MTIMTLSRHVQALSVVVLLAAALSACGGGGGAGDQAAAPAVPPVTTPVTPPTPPVTPPVGTAQTVSLSLGGSAMLGSAPLAISATLDHSADIAWSLGSGNPGTLSSTSGNNVTYTPPAPRVSTITPVTITATSAGVSRSVRVTLYPDPGAAGLNLLAGSLGGHAIIDGTGSAARFNAIAGLSADSDGSVIVADLDDAATPAIRPAVIRQVSSAGVVTTLSRLPFGHADGSASQAKIGLVAAIAVAPDRSIYLIDSVDGHSYLRRLARDGSLTTVAPLPADAFKATEALVVVDSGGNVSVTVPSGIYRLSAGTLTLQAGVNNNNDVYVAKDGAGTAARFVNLHDAVADGAGNLYLLDGLAIRKITPAGVVSTVAGVASQLGDTSVSLDGSGSAARFMNPASLALAANGNLLVLDRDGSGGRSTYLVRQVTPAGVTTTPYTGSDPDLLAALPSMDTRNSRLRVSSTNRIVLASQGQLQVQQDATSASLLAGLEGGDGQPKDGVGGAARFASPALLAADLNGNVYVAEARYGFDLITVQRSGLILRKIAVDGTVTSIATADFPLVANAMQTDSDGNLYVSGNIAKFHLPINLPGGGVYKVTPQGAITPLVETIDSKGTKFTDAHLLGKDLAGNLYVADYSRDAATGYYLLTLKGELTAISAVPANLNQAADGAVYRADSHDGVVYRTQADGSQSVAAGVLNQRGIRLGALPGGLDAPQAVVPYGPDSLVLISGSAVLKLVLPH
jgi:hypothetical protein